jgi:antitoxin VapB
MYMHDGPWWRMTMPLSIRDPRAAMLARDLASRRGTTMTQAIVSALEAELARDQASVPVSRRLLDIAADLKSRAGTDGRVMTRDEIDDMWGQGEGG